MTALTISADKISFSRVTSWFKKLAQQAEYNRAVRSTMKELNALSDRELNDIGICRGDIYSVATSDTTLERVRRNADANVNLKGWV